MNENQYQYQPLNEAEHEIRLLTIVPDTFSAPVRVTLTNTPLTDSLVPTFEALSYTWGSPVDLVRIFIGPTGNDVLFVTQNLATALPYLRYGDRPRVIWIDAICL